MFAESPLTTVVPSSDLRRSRDFFVKRLGLRLLAESEADLRLEAGQGSTLLVYLRPGGRPAEHTIGGFTVSDIYAAADHLAAAGITPEHYDFPGLQTDAQGIAHMGDTLSLWITDPDGNIFGVVQMG